VAYTRFGGSVRVGGVAEPSAFIDQAAQAAGPLRKEFVYIIAAHLVDDEEHDEFGER
jgi:hypothetical protein